MNKLDTSSKDYEFSKMADENVIEVPEITTFPSENDSCTCSCDDDDDDENHAQYHDEEEDDNLSNSEDPSSYTIDVSRVFRPSRSLNACNGFSSCDSELEKHCWVCFASEADEPTAKWTHPCRCRGTTKWVHQLCIQRWVDEKQKGNTTVQVECPQCGTAYTIQLPDPGRLMTFLEISDKLLTRTCPIIAGGLCVGSIYWTSVTFGAVTIMQTIGHEKGLIMMERTDPLLLLVTLPLVPVGLILGKMFRWEDAVLRFLRSSVPKSPTLSIVLPMFAVTQERSSLQSQLPPYTEPESVTRTLCGAMFLPTVASFIGSNLFEQIPSQLKRTLLGGLTFIAVKGMFKIYFKQNTYIRQRNRTIVDFDENI